MKHKVASTNFSFQQEIPVLLTDDIHFFNCFFFYFWEFGSTSRQNKFTLRNQVYFRLALFTCMARTRCHTQSQEIPAPCRWPQGWHFYQSQSWKCFHWSRDTFHFHSRHQPQGFPRVALVKTPQSLARDCGEFHWNAALSSRTLHEHVSSPGSALHRLSSGRQKKVELQMNFYCHFVSRTDMRRNSYKECDEFFGALARFSFVFQTEWFLLQLFLLRCSLRSLIHAPRKARHNCTPCLMCFLYHRWYHISAVLYWNQINLMIDLNKTASNKVKCIFMNIASLIS